jgi:1,2-dihydroxy-3-keto-5-methylthiopentene dioxygenase
MALIYLPRLHQHINNAADAEAFLFARNIPCAHWLTDAALPPRPSQEAVLAAYAVDLTPFMTSRGYATADVVHLDTDTPNLAAIRQKFLQEHTHAEDEVRFFVRGSGDFWYHLSDEPDGLFAVRAMAGDLLAVPAGVKHWFDAGPTPNVTVIRLFTDAKGWEPLYTGSTVSESVQWGLAVA